MRQVPGHKIFPNGLNHSNSTFQNVKIMGQKIEKIKLVGFSKFKCMVPDIYDAQRCPPNIRGLLSKLSGPEPFENLAKIAHFLEKFRKSALGSPM